MDPKIHGKSMKFVMWSRVGPRDGQKPPPGRPEGAPSVPGTPGNRHRDVPRGPVLHFCPRPSAPIIYILDLARAKARARSFLLPIIHSKII